MMKIEKTAQFRRDLRRIVRQGYDVAEMDVIVDRLAAGLPLDKKYRDHALTGNWQGFRECHIQPDWLLVYFVDGGKLILTLSRTGSHSDLFQ